ncbi:hypothetical protein CALVIDRAFT_530145 [Calocera viscosa TUFC12733]|uniref:Protein kinase domain-containing protein n=1 Tax=Calocera viscosa (strain TUFC12733) TaxID=1330018 RepID=A0A167ICD7_CALVF|nr:hypothetical protein CALVIDRAFT_530145 [Calocera viscosa TUFC12733]
MYRGRNKAKSTSDLAIPDRCCFSRCSDHGCGPNLHLPTLAITPSIVLSPAISSCCCLKDYGDFELVEVSVLLGECCYDWSLDKGIFELFPAWANMNGMLALERGAQQVANGGFARVFRTRTKTGGLVAVKVFFDHKRPPARALELSVREAFTWHRIVHPNIVPLLGIADYAKICPGGFPQLCLVSPWISDGNIMEYLKANPGVSPLPLIQEAGMEDEVGTTSSGFNGNARWLAFELRNEVYKE